MFVHELPTTGAISFADFVLATRYSTEVARTTEYRAQLRNVLKENRKSAKDDNDLSQGDWLKIVQAVDDYLPHVFSLFNCVQADDILLKGEPEFSWRTTLSSYLFKSSPRVVLRGLHYEVCAVLLLYGTALSNFAAAAVTSLGNYELDKTLLAADHKRKDDTLKWAADTFCKAAGIFEYLSEQMIPAWEAQVGRIDGRPPDLTKEVTIALSKMALADAQLLSIRKLLSASAAEANDFNTPGPPLPKGHPSASLLAKLYLHVTSLYASATALATTASRKSASQMDMSMGSDAHTDVTKGKGSKGTAKLFGKIKDAVSIDGSSGDGDRQVGSTLLQYLDVSAAVAKALAYKWLGIDAGENGNRYGEGITFLKVAESSINVKKPRSLFGNNNKGKSSRAELQSTQEQEYKNIQHWLNSYNKLNDTVTFQTILPTSDLSSKIPAGRAALNTKPYSPPAAVFGPGSPGYEAGKLEAQANLDGHLASLNLQASSKDDSKYAGANAYF